MRSSSRSIPDFGLTSDDGVALTRRQAVAGASVVVLALVAVLVAALVVEPRSAQRPDVVTGSVILEDDRPPVVVDLATGRPSIRLKDVFAQVGAESYSDVQIVELDTGSMLVNRRTGMFNLLNRGHLAVKREAGGVGLGDADDVESAEAVAAGNGAYIIQRSPNATRVSLVGRDTVEAAVQATAAGGGTVRPRGFVEIDTVVLDEPGRVLGDGDALWLLAGTGDDLEVLRIEPDPERARILTVDAEATVPAPAALALHHTGGGRVAVVGPDGGRLLGGQGGDVALADDGDGDGTRVDTVLPVDTETGPATFLRHRADGWEVVTAGVDGALGRAAVEGIGDQQLTPGAIASGEVWTYALPGAGSAPGSGDDGQPALLRIDRSGRAEPVAGMDRYPRKAAGELAGFEDAAVVARFGRVVFNNPASVLAVMAFAEDDRPPVVIDKSTAIDVSATGAVATDEEGTPDPGEAAEPPVHEPTADEPLPATVSEDAECAETDQQPRVPVLKAPSMSIRTATISWSYPLLDNADCHPSSFSVSVRALEGRQPAQPFLEVVGQTSMVVSGLRPATGYEFIVTAYLNDRSTPSLPRTGTTLPTGPVAPSGVQVTADGRGGWGVTWSSCVSDGCDVPVAEWVVTGARCGGSFVGAPPVVRVD
ncbi:MAG: fibronectin type III domain-containing protein, partial [Acidimicrobiales bacterium]